MGASCTWVIHEYRRPFGSQTKPYAAEVVFFGQVDRDHMLRDLFVEFYVAATAQRDQKQRQGNRNVRDASGEDVQEQIDRQESLNSSWDALHALFCEQKKFRKEWLLEPPDKDNIRFVGILNQMKIWSDDLVRTHTGGTNTTLVQASTPGELLYALRSYTGTIKDEFDHTAASPWPLVQKIRIGLNNALLNQGVVIVDLPGLGDTNQIRCKSSHRALSACTHYLIVANISRAEDNDTVRHYMMHGYLSRADGRVMVACTFADQLDDSSRPPANPREKIQLLSLEEKIESLNSELASTRQRSKRAPREERLELYDRIEELEDELQATKIERTDFRIHLRNRKVANSLKEMYANATSDQNLLPVYCVSNRSYEKHQAGHSKRARPPLSVEGTGIPRLRADLKLTPAAGRLNDTRFLVNIQYPSLILSFELWCSKTHMKRRGELEALVTQPIEAFPRIIDDLFNMLKVYIDGEILLLMKNKEQIWNDETINLCEEWAKDHRLQFTTICKNRGFRKGSKVKEEVRWTRDLLGVAADDLRSPLSRLMDKLAHAEQRVQQDLVDQLSIMKHNITGGQCDLDIRTATDDNRGSTTYINGAEAISGEDRGREAEHTEDCSNGVQRNRSDDEVYQPAE